MPTSRGGRGGRGTRSSRGRGGGGTGNNSNNNNPKNNNIDDGEAITPERPRQQRKGDQNRSPVFYNRRPPRKGELATSTPNNNGSNSTGAGSSTSSSSAGRAGSGTTPQRGRHSSGSGSGHEEGGLRVVVRVRPLSAVEEARGGKRTMRCCNPKSLEFMGTPVIAPGGGGGGGGGGSVVVENGGGSRAYSFDLCAHEGFAQEEMFTSCGLIPLLSAAVDGYAGTVFAYGATGAGKTYTMSGREQVPRGGVAGVQRPSRDVGARSDAAGRGSETDGLVPRSMRYIFQRMASLPLDVTMRVRGSFYEIYNEFVYDLLSQSQRHPLPVRYDVKRGFFVQGLFEVEIRDLRDIMAVVDEGNSNRRVSSHLLNTDSSRSHSLLTLHLHSEWKDPEDGHLVKTFGKVSFVDLAGSERLKKSKTANEKETASINKSLMTLGKVISALSRRSAATATAAAAAAAAAAASAVALSLSGSGVIDSTPSSPGEATATAIATTDPSEIWVPYRDSTLTKLLMDSLGGNGLTLMVACVSPSTRHVEESAATLNYAARARNIRNRPVVRIDARERVINALRREIGLLREENELLRREKLDPLPDDTVGGDGGGAEKGARSAAAAAGGADHRPRGRSENFTPPSVTLTIEEGAGDADPRRGQNGESAVVVDGKPQQKQEDAAAFEIGQASRDVAALLRKYEEECHRLSKEAAIAQHTELEIGKQTRMALMENDALSRTVERLQKTFATNEARKNYPSAPSEEPDGAERTGSGVLASLEGPNGSTTTVHQLSAARSTRRVDTSVAPPASGGARSGDELGLEIMHLRRVNEALVERVESMEQSQLKTTKGGEGQASWMGGRGGGGRGGGGGGGEGGRGGGGGGGGGGGKKTVERGRRRIESSGQVVAEAERRAVGRGREIPRKIPEAGPSGEIASHPTAETVGGADGVNSGRGAGAGAAANPEHRRRAGGQSEQRFSTYAGKGGPVRNGGRVFVGGAGAAGGGRSTSLGRGGRGSAAGAISGSYLIMNNNSGKQAATSRVDATRRPTQRRDSRGRPIVSAVHVKEGNASPEAGEDQLPVHRSARPPSRPREDGRAGRGSAGKGAAKAVQQRVEGLSSTPGGLGGDGGHVIGGDPSPASAAHETAAAAAAEAAAEAEDDDRASGVAASLLPSEKEEHEKQEEEKEEQRKEGEGGEEAEEEEAEKAEDKYTREAQQHSAAGGSTRVVVGIGAGRRAADAKATQPAPKRSKKVAGELVSTVDATVA